METPRPLLIVGIVLILFHLFAPEIKHYLGLIIDFLQTLLFGPTLLAILILAVFILHDIGWIVSKIFSRKRE